MNSSCSVAPTSYSTSDLAELLGVSHEYARRLVAKSGRGVKKETGCWSISISWAEKFCRLRKVCRATKKIDIDFILDMPGRFNTSFQCRLVSREGGEVVSLSENELLKLTEVFGPLPFSLGSEDSSVLRTIEVFNSKRSGGTLRFSWTDVWADRIDRRGSLRLVCETFGSRADNRG